MSEETNKKMNEELSEEEMKDAAGGISVLLDGRQSYRCPRCGTTFEGDRRRTIGKCMCTYCGYIFDADRKAML